MVGSVLRHRPEIVTNAAKPLGKRKADRGHLAAKKGQSGQRLEKARLSFRLSFHPALRGPTGADWLDDRSDLSCKDSTRQHAVDDSRLSCKQLSLTSPAPLLWGCS
jgi:hypothetical protein